MEFYLLVSNQHKFRKRIQYPAKRHLDIKTHVVPISFWNRSIRYMYVHLHKKNQDGAKLSSASEEGNKKYRLEITRNPVFTINNN